MSPIHEKKDCPYNVEIALQKDHQKRMDNKLDEILNKIDDLDEKFTEKFAAKWVEKVLIWWGAIIWVTLLWALLRLIILWW